MTSRKSKKRTAAAHTEWRALRMLLHLAVAWVAVMAAGKVVFAVVCHGTEPIGAADVVAAWWHGFAMDLSTTAYLTALPLACSFAAAVWPRLCKGLVWVVGLWQTAATCAVVAAVMADVALYPHWGFKLDATVWLYADSPRDAVASVPALYVAAMVAAWLVVSLLLVWRTVPLAVAALPRVRSMKRWAVAVVYTLAGAIAFVAMRGGVTEATMNVGNAYFSPRQLLNHTAVNPVFSLLSSSLKSERYGSLYQVMPDTDMARTLAGRYPLTAITATDTLPPSQQLLTTSRPNIVLLFWESLGGQLTASLGGTPGITPRLDSIAAQSLLFTNVYANSFRTDRGTLSTLSGHVAYPLHSLMKMPVRAAQLPSVARTLAAEGYRTHFTYGGDINFTNMKGYLLSTGFQGVTADVDFTLSERRSAKWGVCDSIMLDRLADDILARHDGSREPWLEAAITLSSHEPWDVPASYRRPSDASPKLAAFRYTDAHVGRFLRRLRRSSLWSDMLVVIVADHGVVAADVMQTDTPRFFRIPMLWTGGAAAAPGRVDVLMNQSDLAATLLAQMRLPHDDFVWSRDVLSPAYTRPHAYCTYNDGFAITASAETFAATTQPSGTEASAHHAHSPRATVQRVPPVPAGSVQEPGMVSWPYTTVVVDNKSGKAVTYGDAALTEPLLQLGRAIQQRSYQELAE